MKPRKKSQRKAASQLISRVPRKRPSTISATQAARTFSDLLNRVRYGGEAFVIERGGEPICEMSPITPPRFTGADLIGLLVSLPKPDAGFWDAVEKATRQKTSVPESPWER
jgi:antitoxin (DNA-binding transcriptional repressor) of toxin-antitoxin stability system